MVVTDHCLFRKQNEDSGQEIWMKQHLVNLYLQVPRKITIEEFYSRTTEKDTEIRQCWRAF